MNIGILGSGMVGQAIGGKLAALGHDVVIGTRDPAKLAAWVAETGGTVRAGSFADAAAHGKIVLNATSGGGSLAALDAAGAAHLDGKVLVDIANPLDFSRGMPPSLLVSNTDSLGEQIQRTFPNVRVVKALNTVTASLMVDPRQLADGDHHLLICGNDAAAKAEVTAILRDWFGWRHIVDLGDITGARATESVLLVWVRLWGVLGTPLFNFRIVQ